MRGLVDWASVSHLQVGSLQHQVAFFFHVDHGEMVNESWKIMKFQYGKPLGTLKERHSMNIKRLCSALAQLNVPKHNLS